MTAVSRMAQNKSFNKRNNDSGSTFHLSLPSSAKRRPGIMKVKFYGGRAHTTVFFFSLFSLLIQLLNNLVTSLKSWHNHQGVQAPLISVLKCPFHCHGRCSCLRWPPAIYKRRGSIL